MSLLDLRLLITPLWYLRRFDDRHLYVIVRLKLSDYPFGIFEGLTIVTFMSLYDLRLLITPLWYLRQFDDRHLYVIVQLKASYYPLWYLRRFDDCHHDLVNRYGTSVSQMTTDMFHLS